MNDRPLYSSRILNTYINFVKRNYPAIDVNEVLSYAGVESYQVVDEGHWFTQEQQDRFHEKLVELTGNEKIAREVGKIFGVPRCRRFIKAICHWIIRSGPCLSNGR